MGIKLKIFLLFCLACPAARTQPNASVSPKPSELVLSAPTDKPDPNRFALGVNYIGGQLRYHASPKWAGEVHVITGSGNSSEGRIQSVVIGLRAYRFYKPYRNLKFYTGFEGDYAQSNLNGVKRDRLPNAATSANNFGNTEGLVLGGFGGVEIRLLRRLALDFDCGPYFISLKEKATKVSDASWDFVLNTALVVYLF
jgi:hypothetical protein